jgi:hypothetical protein
MAKGRPSKNKGNVDTTSPKPEPAKEKRQYSKRAGKTEQPVDHTNDIMDTEIVKKGRKRGRKKKDSIVQHTPEEIIDYMIRNFPHMKIDQIKEKTLNGLKIMKEMGDNPYILTKFIHQNKVYYYDDQNAVLNPDGILVGFVIRRYDATNRIYFIDNQQTKQTYQEVIAMIETPDCPLSDDMIISDNPISNPISDPITNTVSQIEKVVDKKTNHRGKKKINQTKKQIVDKNVRTIS